MLLNLKKNTMKRLCLTMGFALVCSLTTAQQWVGDLPLALNSARSSGKKVLLFFATGNACPRCVSIENNVFKDAGFLAFADEYLVLLKPDFDQIDPIQKLHIVEKYNRHGYFPYVVVLDGTGRLLGRLSVYETQTPSEIISELNGIIH